MIDPETGIPVENSGDFAAVPDAFQRLWTPHRLVYIQEGQQPEEHACPFCLAPSKTDADALIVARGEHAYVLLNLFPYNSGHLLVCPYRHVATYDDATPEEAAEIGSLTQTAMRVLRQVYRVCRFLREKKKALYATHRREQNHACTFVSG